MKDVRRRTRARTRTTVILASRAAPPQAAGSQKLGGWQGIEFGYKWRRFVT